MTKDGSDLEKKKGRFIVQFVTVLERRNSEFFGFYVVSPQCKALGDLASRYPFKVDHHTPGVKLY